MPDCNSKYSDKGGLFRVPDHLKVDEIGALKNWHQFCLTESVSIITENYLENHEYTIILLYLYFYVHSFNDCVVQ